MNGQRLVVFGDDWGRHPSSAQHLANCLSNSYEIDWINIAGTRRPQLSLGDLRRSAEKLRQWLGRPEGPSGAQRTTAEGRRFAVHAPIHWPGFRYRIERLLNRCLLRSALSTVLGGGPAPTAVVTTHPLVADMARAYPQLNWVYYCVDDLSVWPGLDGAAIGILERRMLPFMRTVVAASEVLGQRLADLGCRPALLTHGVDVDRWRPAVPRLPCPPGRRVRALYWGSADARLSTEVCIAVAECCDLDLVGPADGLDRRLAGHPRIRVLPPVSHGELPGLAATADVLVMPYADLPVTRAMQPLKLKEYLATGLPVVATALPSTSEWSDAMDVTSDCRQFAELCLARSRQSLPESQDRARRRIARESWAAKARQFEQLLVRRPVADAQACGR